MSRWESYERGLKDGRREVVEWIKTCYLQASEDSITKYWPFYHVVKMELPVKLKEWGIEEVLSAVDNTRRKTNE
jgi:hypothetical protein